METHTFEFVGYPEDIIVPENVYTFDMTVFGASGGRVPFELSPVPAGEGGTVSATTSVNPGDRVTIFVGQQGGDAYIDTTQGLPVSGMGGIGPITGGPGGGGLFAVDLLPAGGGGAATEVQLNGTRVVGGGGGASAATPGGNGGGQVGGTGGGRQTAGQGGTQTNGGAGGSGYYSGYSGGSEMNGAGGNAPASANALAGGGGGGGFFRGGGGAGSLGLFYGPPGGGGGGSSFVDLSDANIYLSVVSSQGGRIGNGQIVITYTPVNLLIGVDNNNQGHKLFRNLLSRLWTRFPRSTQRHALQRITECSSYIITNKAKNKKTKKNKYS